MPKCAPEEPSSLLDGDCEAPVAAYAPMGLVPFVAPVAADSSAPGTGEAAAGGGTTAVEGAGALVSAPLAVGADMPTGQAAAPTLAAAPAAPAEGDPASAPALVAPAEEIPVDATGKKDVLATAKKVADDTAVPHPYDKPKPPTVPTVPTVPTAPKEGASEAVQQKYAEDKAAYDVKKAKYDEDLAKYPTALAEYEASPLLAAWKETTAGDPTNDARKQAIIDGDVQKLKTMMCSEFTAGTLAQAGFDLGDRYVDKGTGLNVAYEEPGKQYYFVRIYDVVGALVEATEAVIKAQKGVNNGVVDMIDPATLTEEERKTHKITGETLPFLLVRSADSTKKGLTFVGKEASDDDEFGAGLAAVALDGEEVDMAARRPGDIQQRLDVDEPSNTYTGKGHSSIVWSVEGTGIARAGESGSPKLVGKTKGLPALQKGVWYSIPDDSGARWALDRDTLPEHVAQLRVTRVQLIDSSIDRDGDSTQVADMKRSKDTKGTVTSSGRLPNSPWFGRGDTNVESTPLIPPTGDKKP